MEKEISEIREKVLETHSEIRVVSEVQKLYIKSTDDKFKVVFDILNNKILPAVEATKTLKEEVEEVGSDLEKHKDNHFSWLKIGGVAVAALSGIIALIDRIRTW